MDIRYIQKHQEEDPQLRALIASGKYAFESTEFDGVQVTTFNKKVWVPHVLQKRIVKWYHEQLQHAGAARTYNSMKVTFNFKGMQKMVYEHCRTCNVCQKFKLGGKNNHGLIPLVQALRDKDPWEKLMADCAGPWTIKVKAENGEIVKFTIHICSMMDACTGWVELATITSASSAKIASAVEKNWFFSKPRPRVCGHDNGPEFMGHEFQDLLAKYQCASMPTTIKNPQANALVERMHLTFANNVRTKVFEIDTWEQEVDTLVQSCAYALRSTVPSNSKYAPGTLAFGMDMLFRQKIIVDWEELKQLRRKQHIANNIKENRNRREHKYKVGDLVLIIMKSYERSKQPKISEFAEGPYKVLRVHKNGTLRIQRGDFEETIHIRRLRPYYKAK